MVTRHLEVGVDFIGQEDQVVVNCQLTQALGSFLIKHRPGRVIRRVDDDRLSFICKCRFEFGRVNGKARLGVHGHHHRNPTGQFHLGGVGRKARLGNQDLVTRIE